MIRLADVGVGDPRRDAFARPVMRVVQMHDQRAQRQLLLAAFGGMDLTDKEWAILEPISASLGREEKSLRVRCPVVCKIVLEHGFQRGRHRNSAHELLGFGFAD